MTYFGFTTLTTIGFGDINPRSDVERAFGAIFFLVGVSIFSLLMTSFIDMLNKFKSFSDDNEGENDDLPKFFGTLRKFNHGVLIDQSLKIEIESYLEFRAKNDRTFGFKNEEDLYLFS